MSFSVYSEWGEDGILEWLIQRLPVSSTRFIEFGVEDYREANTRFLLVNRDWKGLILDSNPRFMQRVREESIYWRYDLTALTAFIDRDNINDLIRNSGFGGNIGVLSIDIDGNDYWVWEAIHAVRPDIVVCEYNAVFGDLHPVSVPYAPDFCRTRAHASNLYFGASIAALVLLGARKGYELAGTNRAGSNAFFVRKDLFPLIESSLQSREPLPSHLRESRGQDGKLTFVSGVDRFEAVAEMPVVRVETGQEVLLRTLAPVYSRAWLDGMYASSDLS